MHKNDVLLRPHITEKAMKDAKNGKYTFFVSIASDKPTIKKAIEEAFKVKVVGMTTTTLKGRTKRVGKRQVEVRLSAMKKAVVALKKGDSIALFEAAAKQ